MAGIKIVFVGDGECGKTSIIRRYYINTFEETYHATIHDSYEKFYMHGDRGYNLKIEDTSGQPDYARLRPLQYHDAQIFVICFAIADPPPEENSSNPGLQNGNRFPAPRKLIARVSFENVASYWHREVRHYRPDAKIVLLGNKSDLRDGVRVKPPFAVTTKEGQNLAKSLKINTYFECSAKTGHNVAKLFDKVVETYLHREFIKKPGTDKKCFLL